MKREAYGGKIMSDEKVERYELTVNRYYKNGGFDATNLPYPDGQFVKYEDYAHLAERVKVLEEAINNYIEARGKWKYFGTRNHLESYHELVNVFKKAGKLK